MGRKAGKPGRKHRSEEEQDRDRARIVDLYYAPNHPNQSEIARILNLDRSTVTKTCKEIEDDWKEREAVSVNREKNRILAEIATVKRDAWNGWLRSVGAKTEKTIRKEYQMGIPTESTTLKKWKDAGDPRLLLAVLECIKDERKIMGIDAPTKVDGNVTVTNFADLMKAVVLKRQAATAAVSASGDDTDDSEPDA